MCLCLLLNELNERAADDAGLSQKQRMKWLLRVVTTPPNAVDGESNLYQEQVTSEFGVKCRMPDKLRAVDMLNKMDGGYEPEVVNVVTEFSFGALLKGLKSTPLGRGHGDAENASEKDGNVSANDGKR